MAVSVVIPAHNEAATIEATICAVLADARPGEFEVIVACNGCSDGTAALARALGNPAVTVVETETASKAAALNLGDDAATAFPRFYLDADIAAPTAVFRELAGVLEQPDVLAVSPSADYDLSRSDWAVRSYYRFWTAQPIVRAGMFGAGLYGCSEAGRRRFGGFPDLIADDLFFHSRFGDDERRKVRLTSACVSVQASRRLTDLIARKTRVYVGNAQFAASPWARTGQHASKGLPQPLLALLRRPWRALDLLTYMWVTLRARSAARRRLAAGDLTTWGRDESRGAAP